MEKFHPKWSSQFSIIRTQNCLSDRLSDQAQTSTKICFLQPFGHKMAWNVVWSAMTLYQGHKYLHSQRWSWISGENKSKSTCQALNPLPTMQPITIGVGFGFVPHYLLNNQWELRLSFNHGLPKPIYRVRALEERVSHPNFSTTLRPSSKTASNPSQGKLISYPCSSRVITSNPTTDYLRLLFHWIFNKLRVFLGLTP